MLVAILAGALIGWIASKIMNTDASMGALANIICGIIGSGVGSFVLSLGNRASFSPTFSIGSLIAGIIGSCIVIAIYKAVSGGRTAV
jgi:uncharacterized membrane protein YeaQ/YmgE (transglycosylase-associated protein family)